MSAKPKGEIAIKIGEEGESVPKLYANQFKVFREGEAVQLFLNFNSGGQNLLTVLLIVNHETLVMNKEAVLKYYERLLGGLTANESPAKQASFAGVTPQTFYGHFLDYAHHGSLAQIRLSYVNTRALSEAVRGIGKQMLESEVLCLVDMTTLLQLGIIKALYMEL